MLPSTLISWFCISLFTVFDIYNTKDTKLLSQTTGVGYTCNIHSQSGVKVFLKYSSLSNCWVIFQRKSLLKLKKFMLFQRYIFRRLKMDKVTTCIVHWYVRTMTDELRSWIATVSCQSTVNALHLGSRASPPPSLLDFCHQTWISISLCKPPNHLSSESPPYSKMLT